MRVHPNDQQWVKLSADGYVVPCAADDTGCVGLTSRVTLAAALAAAQVHECARPHKVPVNVAFFYRAAGIPSEIVVQCPVPRV